MSLKVAIRVSAVSVLSLGAALAVSAPAFAQEAADEVQPGDIVVTAQKRTERLQDVPLAVTAVSAESLAARQINDTNSLVTAIPSLSFQQGANPTNTSFRIRGVGTALFGQGVESSVSVVVDGVVAVRSAQGFSELADIERIEVLRGPQGTLFGKNASAGVISITTARPSDVLEGKGEITVAEHNEYRARGTVSGPITDTLRARVSGFYSDVQGITRNIGTGKWVNGSKSWGLRGKLEWEATSNLTFLLTGEYKKTDSDCCASTLISIVNPVLQSVVGPIDASRKNRTINEDTDTYANSKSQTYSLQANWDLGGSTVTSITAYQKYDLEVNQPIDRINATTPIYLGPPSFAPYTLWNQNHGIVDLSAWSQELRIANNGTSDFNYVLGAFYMHSDIDRPFDRRRARCTAGVVGEPCASTNIVWQSAQSRIRLKQDSIAAFGQADYRLVGGLRAIGGIRVQYEKGTNSGVRTAPIVAGDNVFPGNASTSGTFSAHDTAVTGKAGLQYEFSRNAQVYGTYTRGYKGLGYEMEISADLANQNAIQPEHVNAYEIGFKGSTADRTLSISAALFQADYSNLQVQANRSDPNTGVIRFTTTNAGSSRTRGFEIEATMRPSDSFSVNAAVTYAQSRIDIDGLNCALQLQAGAPVMTGTPINVCYRTSAGATPQQNLRGRPLQASPDWRISVVPRYDYEGDRFNAFAQIGVNFTSAQYLSSELDPLTIQPAYTLVDASVGVSTADKRYNLTVFVKNLFDTNYLTNIGHNSLMSTVANPYDLVATYNKDSSRYFGATFGVRF
ncbi:MULTISPECIES: TonB-dependent receptor [unclassified Novosphingobium]|uniref:TonB-dependent receptor n=1 Tax=unclassified Novosphingobium TaxID=2644732 RepID=UPI00020EF6CE|nr:MULTISPECIES: TonB-dependent receptor [unclassified Novosphingobium]BBA74115.1 outer membrane receptor (OMR) family protein [Novosphingobium sp. PY1]GFM31352.1 outer membrane receptor (OMR) family protein [Novosphingobium sp. PY1]CCA90480.1 outer membrane receptor (OMR) family protein [Novosphingobium sp. PP1Y]